MTGTGQILSELNELKGRLRLRILNPEADTEQSWQQSFGDISPAQLYRRIARAGGQDSDVKVDVDISGGGLATLQVMHNGAFDVFENYIVFGINHNSNRAILEGADMQDAGAGKSIAKGYMREMVAILKDIGMEEISVSTGGVGSYAWLKYGFMPGSDEVWKNLRDGSNIICEGQVNSIASRVSPNGNFIRFNEQSYTLGDDEKAAIQAILSSPSRSAAEHLLALDRPVGKLGNVDLTVGKALLINLSWGGILPLKDGDPGYERFKTYTQERDLSRQQAVGG